MNIKMFALENEIIIQFTELDEFTNKYDTPEPYVYFSINHLGSNLSDFLIYDEEELDKNLTSFINLIFSIKDDLLDFMGVITMNVGYFKAIENIKKSNNTFISIYKMLLLRFFVYFYYNGDYRNLLLNFENFFNLDTEKKDALKYNLSNCIYEREEKDFLKARLLVLKDVMIEETLSLQDSVTQLLSDYSNFGSFKKYDIMDNLFLKLITYQSEINTRNVKVSFTSSFEPAFPKTRFSTDNIPLVIAHKYDITCIFDLLFLEYRESLTNNISIKPCRYCKRFFVSDGRIDKEYCDNIAPGENLPCSQIGATKLHYKEKEDDPVYTAFLTAYRRMRSRVRTGKLTKEDFTEWSQVARTKRDACNNNELNFDEYKEWLSSNKIS